ncbi:MCE family protein [Pseudonocardia spinosispora]|uniref:MCE family protein n=1 Tax=Pseudonocardia spinosispora TaxID=103441 RepID=UPI000414D650|nr:MCE family protein [Pseudonocardia spinosispora]
MISAYIRRQLAVFALLALSAVLIIVFGYAHLPTVLGYGQMQVTALFADGAGVYPNGNVTARGAQIGKIKSVSMTPAGVAVTMSVEQGVKVALDARAELHSQSAVGEQYVDLVSEHPGGPYLRPGTVIPMDRTSVPVQIAPVLDKVTDLLASVPDNGVQTFLDEGYLAFQNLGPDLRTLTRGGVDLVDEADRNYPQTAQLITTVGPLLDTQNVAGDSVRASFSRLAHFTGVLADQDGHLRHGVPALRDAAGSVAGFLNDNYQGTSVLAGNLRTVGGLLGVYRPALEQVFTDYPIALAWEQIITDGPNRGGHAGLQLNVYPGCTQGFQSTAERNGNDLTDKDPVPNTYCKVPHNDPRVVRGARNIPCLEGKVGVRAATAQECLGRAPDETTGDGTPFAPENPLATGRLPQSGPLSPPAVSGSNRDDPLAALGGTGAPGKETPWQSLLTGPLNP